MPDTTRMAWIRRETERKLLAQMALERQEFAARLRRLREQHDPPMTQEKAAAFLNVPPRTYVRWENREVDASLASREKVARAYGIDPQELIADDSSDARVTLADLTRLEQKVDQILTILEALAGAHRSQTRGRRKIPTRTFSPPYHPPR